MAIKTVMMIAIELLENTEFGADAVINYANKMLIDGNSFRGCTLKIACWTAYRQKQEWTQTMLRLTNNKLLSAFINATAVEDAILSGRNGRSCAKYTPCPIKDQYIPLLLNNLSVLTKSNGL